MSKPILLGLWLLLALGSIIGPGCHRHTESTESVSPTAPRSTPLDITLFTFPSQPVSIGNLKPGERIELDVRIHNNSESPVLLGPIETSCECLHVEIKETRVAAGSTISGVLVLDFQKDPSYTGGLMLTAVANTVEPIPRKAFTIRLLADVK